MFIHDAAVDKQASSAVSARCIRKADRTDKQDVCVSHHPVQNRRKFRQLHLERVKVLVHAPARIVHRLDQLTRALLPRRAQVVGAEVAITRKVIHSDGVASVTLRSWMNVVRCLDRTAALWVMVWTILMPALVSPDTRMCEGGRARNARETERRRTAYLVVPNTVMGRVPFSTCS